MSKLDRGKRPSPKESATLFPEGYEAVGQDGNKWKISVTHEGVHRWVKEHLYKTGGMVDNELFEVATFNNLSGDDSDSTVLEGSLLLSDAIKKAKKLWKSKKYEGVEVVSQNPDSAEPIRWIKSKRKFADGGEIEEDIVEEPVGETAFGEIYKTEALGGSPLWMPDSVIYNGQDLQLVYLSPIYRVKNPDLIDITPEEVLEDYTEDEIKELPAAPENIEEVIEEVEPLDEPLDEEELAEAEQGAAAVDELEAAESVPAEVMAEAAAEVPLVAAEESTEVPAAVTEAAAETAEIVDSVASAEVVNEGEPEVITDTPSEVTTEQVTETTEGTVTETITEKPEEEITVTETITEPESGDAIVTETITESPEETVTETITEKPAEDTTITETVTETRADDMIVTETVIETPEDIVTATVTEEPEVEPVVTVEYEQPKSEVVEASAPETVEFKRGGFVDAQKMHKLHPVTFEIPTEKQLDKVAKGSFVKIATGGERFWVKVESVKGNVVKGTVNNDLLNTSTHGLKDGDAVTFLKKNIYNVDLPVKKKPKPVKKMEKGGGLHLNEYKFKVKHDHGTMTMKKVAESKEAAIKSICKAEGCPESALTFVEEKKLFAKGGAIPNNYKGKNIHQVWVEWTPKQKKHFIYDHSKDIEELSKSRDKVITNAEKDKWASAPFNKLPDFIKNAISVHIVEGQYASGGAIKKTVSVPKKKRIDLELARISDLIKGSNNKDAIGLTSYQVKSAWMYYRSSVLDGKMKKGDTPGGLSVAEMANSIATHSKISILKALYLTKLFKDQLGAIAMGKLYTKGGGIGKKENPEKKFWAKHMKTHTELVRSKAVAEGWIKKGEKLTDSAVEKLKKLGGIWKKRAISIANTKTYKKGGCI